MACSSGVAEVDTIYFCHQVIAKVQNSMFFCFLNERSNCTVALPRSKHGPRAKTKKKKKKKSPPLARFLFLKVFKKYYPVGAQNSSLTNL